LIKSIAITGANGFLGRHCVSKAVEQGFTVYGVVRRAEAAQVVEAHGGIPKIVQNFQVDELVDAFTGSLGVLHLIGIVNERYSSFQEVNVQGTRAVLKSALRSGIQYFVTPSGLGVDQYGHKSWATNGYFLSKRQIEAMCQNQPIPFVIFRPSYILGPGDELIPFLVHDILEGKVLVAGHGDRPMQPIYVQDAATAFINAVTGQGSHNQIYDLVGPEIITFTQLINRVATIMEMEGYDLPEFTIEYVPIPDASNLTDIAQEEIDVMLSDAIGDPSPLCQDFKLSLTPLDTAIQAAVQAESRHMR
jgi:nucleoside-diphosphate-sugar epimerase